MIGDVRCATLREVTAKLAQVRSGSLLANAL
jgi:hypothetical protein